MKELSIEEKAKAYDKIIERIKDYQFEYRFSPFGDVISDKFPELKESEDKKPNRAIVMEDFNEGNGFYKVNLAYLNKEQVEDIENIIKRWNVQKYNEEAIRDCIGVILTDASEQRFVDFNTSLKDCLTWLEKQGEKPIDKIQIGKQYKCIASPRYSTFMRGEIYKPEDKFLCSLMNFCSNCFEPIEDGEQKPAFEMKTPEKSLGIDSNTYNKIVDECIYGEQKPADKVEPKFKIEKDKWYVCTSQYCNCIEGRNYKASLDGRIIDDYGTEYNMHSDAYRWFRPWTIQDAKDGDVLTSDYEGGICTALLKNVLSISEIEMYCHLINDDLFIPKSGYSNAIWHPATKEQRNLLFQKMKDAGYEWDAEKKELKKIEQDYAWSEEDEKMLDEMYEFFDKHKIPSLKHNMDDYVKFIKSIKERVKPHNRWKPSDEQMNTLEQWLKDNQYKGDARYCYPIFESLYQDLKKLKEIKL